MFVPPKVGIEDERRGVDRLLEAPKPTQVVLETGSSEQGITSEAHMPARRPVVDRGL